MRCMVSVPVLVLLTIIIEGLLWWIFSVMLRKRVAGKCAEVQRHRFTGDLIVRGIITLWFIFAGGVMIAAVEIVPNVCLCFTSKSLAKIPDVQSAPFSSDVQSVGDFASTIKGKLLQ